MKSFLKQIKYEIRNIIKSRFMLIIGILLIVSSIAFPIINLINDQRSPDSDNGIVRPLPIDIGARGAIALPEPIYPGTDQESITIDGITIYSTNPFFWQISYAMQEKEIMENDRERFTNPEALDLALSLMDAEIQYYLNFAKYITEYTDYRIDLAARSLDSLYDKFIFENIDAPEEALLEAVSQKKYMDEELFRSKYLELSSEDRLAALEKLDEELNILYSIVESNDFSKYIEMRIEQENKAIADLQEQIAIQEQEIVKNPSQEDIINEMIEELKRNIAIIEENTIPILELRREKNIIPGEDTWQNRAINDIEMYRQQLAYTEILSEEEFRQQMWLVQQYGSYQNYVAEMQAQIDEMNHAIIIAEKSIYADKPDMKFVPGGPRNRTTRFLNYSVFVTLFAVLLGGWLMASEFQQGTIRLLLIRPKNRIKILAAKFVSALIVCLAVYITGCLLNALANGICFGFSDYAFPNYTLAGEIGFIVYYLPKMLACAVPIIFGYALAFMLSVIIKNVAVSIATPIALNIASIILMGTLAFTYRTANKWLAYTPLPYMHISAYVTQGSSAAPGISSSIPINLTYGIILLLALSALCAAVSSIIFNKADIVN